MPAVAATTTSRSPRAPRTREGGRHRYTRSLTDEFDDPRPLPTPPSRSPSRSPTRSTQVAPLQEAPLRPTIDPFIKFIGPSAGVASPITPQPRKPPHSASLHTPIVPPLEILPPNPKEWSPEQLSTYLGTALEFKSNINTPGRETPVQIPPRVVDDIAAFIKNKRITGQQFLGWEKNDLEGYAMDKLWSTALLTAARNLRQDILEGELWSSPTSTPMELPFESSLGDEDEDEDEDTSQSKKQRAPFYSTSSVSTPNLGVAEE